MHVLVLGSDSPLGNALCEWLEALGRHQLESLSTAACRWKSERQAKKAVRRSKPDVVVDLRLEAEADGGKSLHDLDIKRCGWIAKSCQRDQAICLFVSSSRVFSGELDRYYHEGDTPDSKEALGLALAQAETLISAKCERHIILRLGPVFSSAGPNLITYMLGEMMQGSALVLDNNLRGCPVASNDGARVISALLDQLSTGPELWGTYHYCSSDSATHYEFAEAVLAAASQFSEFSSSAVELEQQQDGQAPLNRSLDCSRIRNTFAIKQIPWRGAIADLVKQYFQQQ